MCRLKKIQMPKTKVQIALLNCNVNMFFAILNQFQLLCTQLCLVNRSGIPLVNL